MRYLPHTEAEIKAMLEVVGLHSIDDLFASIPKEVRLKNELNLEPALDEASLMSHLKALAAKSDANAYVSFLGAGIYAHHIPPAVDQLLGRNEFYTAYTPYQAEVAQGTLQSIYEFQTLVCQLFEMDVANASMYDGASATAEAVLMARRITKRNTCLISEALHPEYTQTVETYLQGLDEGKPDLKSVPIDAHGQTDLNKLKALLNEQVAAVVLGYPNFFGCIEDLKSIETLCHEKGVMLITATAEPYALSLLKAPGKLGVDIAVGEGQALAVGPQLGGPGVGLFSCKKEFLRQMPGRLVGQTTDSENKRGFVLTLSTREQHIRRERATSNICTNHGLIALAFAIRVALLGKKGFVQVGKNCFEKAEYLKSEIRKCKGYEIAFSAATFNEFTVRSDIGAKESLALLEKAGILGGLDLARFFSEMKDKFIVAVTEKHSIADLDLFVKALKKG